jgi:hypothetical protein
VLFELWLYSSTSEADMWGSLLHLVPRWVHHLPTINQWLAVCKGLTERAISFMYGPEEGRECVLIQLYAHHHPIYHFIILFIILFYFMHFLP